MFVDGVPPAREAVLTDGEFRVLDHLREGKNQSVIAREMGRSAHTVRTIARNLRSKFGAHTVEELLRGLDVGVYIIARKAVAEPPTFDLASAVTALERLQRNRLPCDAMLTVRLHRHEVSAILELARTEQRRASECRRSRLALPPSMFPDRV